MGSIAVLVHWGLSALALLVLLGAFGPRALYIVLGGTVAFGYLLKPLGLVLATVVLIVVSAWGGHEFKLREVDHSDRRAGDIRGRGVRLRSGAADEHLAGAGVSHGRSGCQSHARLRRRAVRPEPPVLPDGRAARHADRRAARHRAGRHHRHAAAGDLHAVADLRADHAGRHLLRRAVRRLDHRDPGQPARRVLLGGHLPGRLPDGAPGPRRPGAGHRGDRLVLRRLRRHAGHRAVRAAARGGRAEVRPGRVLLADGAGPGRRRWCSRTARSSRRSPW